MREWKFPSSSSSKIYTTQINPTTGLLSCDCPGWTVKKLGKVRMCKHTYKVTSDEGLMLEVRDDQQFVIEGKSAGTMAGNSTPAVVRDSKARTTPTPALHDDTSTFVNPMLASKMPEGKDADSYNTPDYIMEEKFDGHRLVIRILPEENLGYFGGSGDNIILRKMAHAWSRLGNPRTLPTHLLNLLTDMPEGVYDGELIVPGQHSYDVTAGQNSGTERLVLFDIMEVLGQSVMTEPWAKRHEFLKLAYEAIDLGPSSDISLAQTFIPSKVMVQAIWDRGGEGTIIKNVNSKYSPGWRTPDWIKVKAVNAATLTIIGFEAGKNGPYSVAKLRDDAGIETTVKTLDNKTMKSIALNPDGWIGKRLVISYHERLPGGKYRHPMWDHEAGEGE